MDRYRKTLCYIFFLIVFFAGCSSDDNKPQTGQVFVDDLQRKVVISQTPKRIISMAPNITEILFALGANNEIVGVTDYCDYPPEAKTKTKIGGFINPNIEVITELKPDIIFATYDGNRKESIYKLEELGFTTFVVNSRNLDDVLKNVQALGIILNRKSEISTVIENLNERIQRVSDNVKDLPKPKVLLLYSIDPVISVNRNTFAHDLIIRAGALNIAADAETNYPQYNMETILEKNPDVVIFAGMDPKLTGRLETEWEKWESLSAVKNKRLYTITSDELSRPGPRIVDGLEILAKLIHEK